MPETIPEEQTGFRARQVTVRYGNAAALDSVSFDLQMGEIHALVGENGAGKSTLVRVLTGATVPMDGTLLLDGQQTSFASPRDAQAAGVAVVHQDNQLFPDLTVWENVAATASLPSRVGPLVARRATCRRVERVFDEFGMDIDPLVKARTLAAAERKVVEIARALLLDPRFLLLDEPTATLTPDESERLAELIVRLRDSGRGIVLVTHHLEEVLGIADRTTVLRDGRWAGTFTRADLTRDVLISAMLGGQVEARLRTARAALDETVLEIRSLRLTPSARPIDLSVRRGELVAMVGLVGSGATALLERIGGARRDLPGTLVVRGRQRKLRSPADAVRHDIGYLSADRKGDGLVGEQSVAVNVALASLPKLTRAGFCDRRRIAAIAEEVKERLNIRCQSMHQPIRTLSGGNQQKALVARWLTSGVQIMLIDEPTHGVDIRARAEIHEHLRRFAADGGTVLFATSDLDEALVMADRILVMRKGEVGAELVIEEMPALDRAGLLALVTGLSAEGQEEVSA
jgi:ribose transport system ATP-binding protein